MVMQIAQNVCNGYMLKLLLASGFHWLAGHQEHINRMNVFPVPDGDTGTNMRLTLKKAYDAIADTESDHAGQVATAFARGALLGARGNSGVILSQLIGGFAESIHDDALIDAQGFARGCVAAVERAYKAVLDPVEGTILTVSRQATDVLMAFVQENDDLAQALEVLIEAGRQALERTPEQLPVLKKAGVIDSGGLGLLYMLEGMSRTVQGLPVMVNADESAAPEGWGDALHPEDEEGYGYDVQFLMYGSNMDVERIQTDLNAMGWSTLVVGDSTLIKVHIHVHDPGEPLSYAVRLCDALDDVVVENMQRQYEAYVQDRSPVLAVQRVPGVAVVAVATGDGLKKVFYDAQAAYVIDGGQTMNPSTDDFLQAIDALENDEVILLPNNKNIVLAAQQAAQEAAHALNKRVHVIPTRTVPQGISAMLAYLDLGDDAPLTDLINGMEQARHYSSTGEITTAIRDADFDGGRVTTGQIIGLLDDVIVAAADTITEGVMALLQAADLTDYELITLYYGADVNDTEAQTLAGALRTEYPDLRVEVVAGHQPLYPYLIGLE